MGCYFDCFEPGYALLYFVMKSTGILLFAIPFVAAIILGLIAGFVLASPFLLLGFIVFQWRKTQRMRLRPAQRTKSPNSPMQVIGSVIQKARK